MTTLHAAQSARTLLEIATCENKYFAQGRTPEEGDWGLNDLQRAKVEAFAAMRRAGSPALLGPPCWLGRINLHHDGQSIMVAHTGQPVRNGEYAFVVPTRDAELEQMIRARAAAPYTSVATDAERVSTIIERIRHIGGLLLYWV
jgi:hypothetical protein